MEKKKIYYTYPRRKWDNDIVNSQFEHFDFGPKADIRHDQDTITEKVTLKQKLKKYKFMRKLGTYKFRYQLFKNNYVHKYKINEIKNYDGAVLSQLFLKDSDKCKIPYMVYIENSHSIFAYDYEKYENLKYRNIMINEIKKCVNDENFKGFIFYSERSKEGFYKYFNDIVPYEFKFQSVIYPFVKDNILIDKMFIKERAEDLKNKSINLLYISSMFSLKGGCEIIESYLELKRKYDVTLTMVTNPNTIPNKYLDYINEDPSIHIFNNNLDNNELHNLYKSSHILLHPTFMDSTAIVIMEALKSGLPVIATDTYAIPEYIQHGENGFLIENPIKYWDEDMKPNYPLDFFGSVNTANYIDKYKSNTLYKYIINDLTRYVSEIVEDYELYSMNAYELSMTSSYTENETLRRWNEVGSKLIDGKKTNI
ncbi:glycosyltransferase family 4 protein [Clostridium polynesiense]|uniref:glycosyltransferase family 4 protein n=1 Tax=Clostridium polynesiense TaxID=1325933 RepID=UPI000590D766|nr:glycosyltransferase family 4 protein [Clostridium polynesiense]